MYTVTRMPLVPVGLSALGPWVGETLRLFRARWRVYLGQGAIYALPLAIPELVLLIVVLAQAGHTPGAFSWDTALQRFGRLHSSVGYVGDVYRLLLLPGMVRTALKQLRGEEVRVGDLFSGIRFFWGALLVRLLEVAVPTACGIALLAIGRLLDAPHMFLGVLLLAVGVPCAFIVATLLILAVPLMVDQALPTRQAIARAWRAGRQNLGLFLLFTLVLLFAASLGSLVLSLGAMVTAPLAAIGVAVAYYRVFYPLDGDAGGEEGVRTGTFSDRAPGLSEVTCEDRHAQ